MSRVYEMSAEAKARQIERVKARWSDPEANATMRARMAEAQKCRLIRDGLHPTVSICDFRMTTKKWRLSRADAIAFSNRHFANGR